MERYGGLFRYVYLAEGTPVGSELIRLGVAYRLDILAMLALGIPNLNNGSGTYLGMALTGLLISRGANYLHDWIANPLIGRLVNSSRPDLQP